MDSFMLFLFQPVSSSGFFLLKRVYTVRQIVYRSRNFIGADQKPATFFDTLDRQRIKPTTKEV